MCALKTLYTVNCSVGLCQQLTDQIQNTNKLLSAYLLYESLSSIYCKPVAIISCTEEKLEAAHHKFQRRLRGITWKDKVKNEEIQKRIRLKKLEDLITKRTVKWLGHVLRMSETRIHHQAICWECER